MYYFCILLEIGDEVLLADKQIVNIISSSVGELIFN